MDVVADGRLIRARMSTRHPRLFWRSAEGNWRHVNIEYSLFPVGPEIVGGAIACHDDAERVLGCSGVRRERFPK
jgi:hypothetical protein